MDLWRSILAGSSISPDSELIISGSDDKTVRIRNARYGKAYGNPFEGHTDSVSSVLFSRDGRKIISGSHDGTIRFWDVATGAAWLTIKGHTLTVNSIAISPDGEWIVSASGDRTIRLWSTSTGEALSVPLLEHSNIVTSAAISPDGRYVISRSEDRTIRKWDVGMARQLFQDASADDGESSSACQDGDSVFQRHYNTPLLQWDWVRALIVGREGAPFLGSSRTPARTAAHGMQYHHHRRPVQHHARPHSIRSWGGLGTVLRG